MSANTLKEQYPGLYNIVRKESATIADIISTTPLNVENLHW
jgi:hypothetical protein